jgi:hypothetical protein
VSTVTRSFRFRQKKKRHTYSEVRNRRSNESVRVTVIRKVTPISLSRSRFTLRDIWQSGRRFDSTIPRFKLIKYPRLIHAAHRARLISFGSVKSGCTPIFLGFFEIWDSRSGWSSEWKFDSASHKWILKFQNHPRAILGLREADPLFQIGQRVPKSSKIFY